MSAVDYAVIAVYFLVMVAIGLWLMRIKGQEDFLLGGRRFGVVLQTFAAFGAGTGSQDIVTTSRTTYDNGLSGMWSILQNLWVTPFYWFYGIWFRRMRHLTLGDFFVERFQSRAMGVAYTAYGTAYILTLLGLNFLAIDKFTCVLLGMDTMMLPWLDVAVPVRYVTLPIIGLVVGVYTVLGGLRAGYWTDLVQGICIIVLSVILIPTGLSALAVKFGESGAGGVMEGFRVLHRQLPAEFFDLVGTGGSSLFTLPYIVTISLMGLLGAAANPFLISVGGGSAKSETAARVGLMTGTLMKRLCTIGWALTALIVIALTTDDDAVLAADPDRVWGVATTLILGPFELGLVGLMAACLLAALMSSVNCYVLAVAGLVVRNVYAAYVDPQAGEKSCVRVGRLTSVALLLASVVVSLWRDDLFEQVKMCWELPLVFIAPFWAGMFWRRATKWATWMTLVFSTMAFFIIPSLLPAIVPSLREDARYVSAGSFVTTITLRPATPADVARREGAIRLWQQRAANASLGASAADASVQRKPLGPCPAHLSLGEVFADEATTGGEATYWQGGVCVVNDEGVPEPAARRHCVELGRQQNGNVIVIREKIDPKYRLRGEGAFNLTVFLCSTTGVNLTDASKATLETVRYAMQLAIPFALLILLSLITPRDDRHALDRFYVKMKTPVAAVPELDLAELERSYRDPSRFDAKRLLPFLGLEIQKPGLLDIAGFAMGIGVCLSVIGLAVWLAGLGG